MSNLRYISVDFPTNHDKKCQIVTSSNLKHTWKEKYCFSDQSVHMKTDVVISIFEFDDVGFHALA